MSLAWPDELPDWVVPPPDVALANWRGRIARVTKEETAYLVGLPYVRALAVIGSVGRDDPWPLSDVDMLVVADPVDGQHPCTAVRCEEQRRNERLHRAGIPNDVEASIWTITREEIRTAMTGDAGVLLGKVGRRQWYWMAFVAKACGGTVVTDRERQLARFIERCNQVLASRDFRRRLCLQDAADLEHRKADARRLLEAEEWPMASFRLMRMAHEIASPFYFCWGSIPQSISRCVSRFLSAAQRAGQGDIGGWFLDAARLRPEHVEMRFDGLPDAATTERDRLLAIRNGSGESVDELEVTRDMLHVRFWCDVGRSPDLTGPFPKWTGVADGPGEVEAQYHAMQQLLQSLREEGRGSAR